MRTLIEISEEIELLAKVQDATSQFPRLAKELREFNSALGAQQRDERREKLKLETRLGVYHDFTDTLLDKLSSR